MSLFTVVADNVVLSVVPFPEAAALANEQRQRGCRVAIHRATPQEQAAVARGWAVRVYAAGTSDVLHCLDQDDAQETLRQVRAFGLRAEIVRV